MGDGHDAAVEQTERDESLLAVMEAIIENCDRLTLKHFLDADKINAMVTEIGLAFSFISLKLHERECNYKM